VPFVHPPDLTRNNFDALRFALAALVVFSHSFALLSGTDATEPLHRLTRGQIASGELAVDGFFILSGFLVTHSWAKVPSLVPFFRKRVSRIYPGFAVVTILSTLFLVPVAYAIPFGSFPPGMLAREALSMLTLRAYEPPGAFPGNAVHALNGSLWSIPIEAWCYVGVVTLGLLGMIRRRRDVAVLLAGALALSLAFLIWNLNPGLKLVGAVFGWPRLWARMLPYFLSGMVFYLYRDRIRYTPRGAIIAGLALVAAIFVPHGLAVAGPLAGAYLLFWLGFSPSIRLHEWAKYGDFSYGMYLYAFPLQQLIIHGFRPTHPLVLFFLSLPASVAMGALSWHGVEKWFLKRLRKSAAPAPVLAPSPNSAC
jgi:peptidoglycan/LPS O-acetylase OafA/YrhL